MSEFIKREAIRAGSPPGRVHVVENPAVPWDTSGDGSDRSSARHELGLTEEDFVIGTAGRLTPWKGQRESLEAFALLAGQNPNFAFVVIGDGELRPELENRAQVLGVSSRVMFTGWRADMGRLLAALDIFVHPSYDEPFGLAVLEAQLAGLPVVAFDEGAIPEIVDNGRSGVLVPDRDVGALAVAIEQLAADPDMRSEMGRVAAARARRAFDKEVLAERFRSTLAAAARRVPDRPAGPTCSGCPR